METLIFHPENNAQLAALKAIAKVLKIKIETKKDTYDPEFVKIIKKAEKRGSYKTIDANDVWGSLNLK